jgi:hypothetical protein
VGEDFKTSRSGRVVVSHKASRKRCGGSPSGDCDPMERAVSDDFLIWDIIKTAGARCRNSQPVCCLIQTSY